MVNYSEPYFFILSLIYTASMCYRNIFFHSVEVFKVSKKCSNDFSLNKRLFIGRELQKDISQLLLNFRCHKFLFSLVIKHQHISSFKQAYYIFLQWTSNGFWISSTYRVKSSPHLALWTLVQITQVEGDSCFAKFYLCWRYFCRNINSVRNKTTPASDHSTFREVAIIPSFPANFSSSHLSVMFFTKHLIKRLRITRLCWHRTPSQQIFHIQKKNKQHSPLLEVLRVVSDCSVSIINFL